MALSKAFDDASVYAAKLFPDQVRRDPKFAHIGHLMTLSSRLLMSVSNCSALMERRFWPSRGFLHDAAEDRGGEPTLQETRRRFGSDDCTDSWITAKPDWRPRKG